MKYLLLLFVLCLSLEANAQRWTWERDPNAKGPIIWTGGNLNCLNLQVRGPKAMNLSGVDVMIVSRKDTIRLEVVEGSTYCDALLADSVWIKVNCEGYETVEGKIKSRTSYEIRLKKKTAEAPETVSAGGEVGSPEEPR